MGGHEHGHHAPPYTVPDYKIYQVKDAPLLVTTEKALAAQGLKDPWLRNEVWRYNEKQFGSEKTRVKTLFLRGFRVGFGAFIVTIAGTAAWDYFHPVEHHGHH